MYKIHIVDYQGSILNFFKRLGESYFPHYLRFGFHRILDFKKRD